MYSTKGLETILAVFSVSDTKRDLGTTQKFDIFEDKLLHAFFLTFLFLWLLTLHK